MEELKLTTEQKRELKKIERKEKKKQKDLEREEKKTFNKLRKEEEVRLLKILTTLSPDSKEYEVILARLGGLADIKKEEKPTADAVLGNATSLIGLAGATIYDGVHNLPSTARGWVPRPKQK